MGILKAYGDESGKANDPNCPAVSMAAVIGEVQSWQAFSGYWKAMLEKHEIPYLHMKEVIGARHTKKGPFAKFIDNDMLSYLLRDATHCILKAELYSVSMSVFVDDLKAVMRRHDFRVDPLSFTIYLSTVYLGTWALNFYPEDPSFHLVLDRMEKGSVKVTQAEKLHDSSGFSSWRGWPAVTALRPNDREGSRSLQELQAADLVAWCTRNQLLDIRYWMQNIKPTMPGFQPDAWDISLEKWLHARLDGHFVNAPEKIAFYRVVETLNMNQMLKTFHYDEEQLERHVVNNWNHQIDEELKMRSCVSAGRLFPLTP